MRIRCVDVGYRLTLTFGYHKGYPLNNGYHYGTDYVHENRNIVAPQDGKVTSRGYNKTSGNYLVVEGNGFRDYFAHLEAYKVNVGDTVKMGDSIAVMGNTGYSTGTHVHHSVRKDGVLVDAEEYIVKPHIIENNSLWHTRMNKLMQQIRGRSLSKTEFEKNFVGQDAWRMTEVLSDNPEADKAQIWQDTGKKLDGKVIKLTKGVYEV